MRSLAKVCNPDMTAPQGRWNPAEWKSEAVLAVVGLLLASCVAAVVGDDEDERLAAKEGVAKALDTSQNRTSCEVSRREMGEAGLVLADYANGTALPADAAKAAQEVQKELGENASNSTGEIRTELLALTDVMGRIGVAFTDDGIEDLATGFQQLDAALKTLDRLCTSIDS